MLTELPNVIDNSIEIEEHPDYKIVNGGRSIDNGVGDASLLVHRMYGAVQIDGKTYRVKTTMHEHNTKGNAPHDYRVTKIELIISGSPTSNALNSSIESLPTRLQTSDDAQAVQREVYLSAAKLLQNVEKAYNKGKNILDESKNADESTDLYRDGDDFTVSDKAIARDAYERMVMSGASQFTEAVQDSMLSLKNLYKAILLYWKLKARK